MLYSAGSGVSSVHVVLSVLRSRSLSFVHLSTSCRYGCMLAFAMFMSVCGAVMLLLFAMIRSVVKSFKVPDVEVAAARMSNESALTRMTDSTPKNPWSDLTLVLDG